MVVTSEANLIKSKMKREGNLYEQICRQENILLADQRACKGKSHQKAVKLFDENKEFNLAFIHECLLEQTYQVSAYETFKLFQGKERLIQILGQTAIFRQ